MYRRHVTGLNLARPVELSSRYPCSIPITIVPALVGPTQNQTSVRRMPGKAAQVSLRSRYENAVIDEQMLLGPASRELMPEMLAPACSVRDCPPCTGGYKTA
jgi:hypothetical protein